MIKKPKLLIVSTNNDPSLELFNNEDIDELIDIKNIKYDSNTQTISTAIRQAYDYIYLRDPFNDPKLNQKKVKETAQKIVERQKQTYFVDSVKSYDEMLFEDKFLQYKFFSRIMPNTKVLNSLDKINFDKEFVKKRISSRSKGIMFSKNDFPSNTIPNDYLLQEKLEINIEYRVFIIGGEIIKPIAIKSSKLKEQKVRMLRLTNELNVEIVKICNEVYEKTGYDFVGLDIAETNRGFHLFEINRSPQFLGYYRLSSINLAGKLISYLIS